MKCLWRSLFLCWWSVRWRLLLLLQALYCRSEVKSRVMCLWLVLRSLHSGNPIRVTQWKPLKNKFICASSAWPERILRAVKVGQRSHSGQLEHTLLWHRANELRSERQRVKESESRTVSQRVLNKRPVTRVLAELPWTPIFLHLMPDTLYTTFKVVGSLLIAHYMTDWGTI